MSDPVAQYDTRFNWWAALGAGVWLIFLAPAAAAGWAARDTMAGWIGLCALAGFCFLYVWSFIWARPYRHDGRLFRTVQPQALAILGGLFALGAVIVLTLHQDGLATAVYVAVAGITMLPPRWSLPLAGILALGAEALARTVPGWEGADGVGLSVLLASFAVWGMWTAMRRTRDLLAAKEENALLMVDQERARMARDLHDILGHSLTVIAVKAELADRLVDVSPERARAEIADIQRLSRDALADVRRTVDGVRELSLPAELARARSALQAAEITADLPWSTTGSPSRTTDAVCGPRTSLRCATVTVSPDFANGRPPRGPMSSSRHRRRAGSGSAWWRARARRPQAPRRARPPRRPGGSTRRSALSESRPLGDDPAPARRRPGPRPRRARHPARPRTGHDRRGRGRPRRRGGRRRARVEPRRRPPRRRDARHGRDRGHPRAPRSASGRQGRHRHDVRAARLPAAGPGGRR